MRILHTFHNTHSNDVTGVTFNTSKQNLALTCGEDYLMNLIDIKGDKADDFIEASYTASQPLAKCGFIDGTGLAYCISTVNTLEIVDLEEMV